MYNNIFVFKKNITFILFLFFYLNVTSESISNYLKKYAPIAVYEMQHSGIPASIKLSQSILESYYGNSILAKEANNHFGIKCGKYWIGDIIEHDDDEKNECFRKYDSAWESFIDHSKFLKKPRYSKLFLLCKHDYKSWAKGLKDSGYATSEDYDKRLVYNIEQYQLWRFDNLNFHDFKKFLDLKQMIFYLDKY